MDSQTAHAVAEALRATAATLSADSEEAPSQPTPGALSYEGFHEALLAAAERLIGDRQLKVSRRDPRSGQLFVNFINLPEGHGSAGGGAEAQNNRAMFVVQGFAKGDSDVPVARVTVKEAIPFVGPNRERLSLRGKTGSPAVIAKYLAAHLGKLAAMEPNWTHSAPPRNEEAAPAEAPPAPERDFDKAFASFLVGAQKIVDDAWKNSGFTHGQSPLLKVQHGARYVRVTRADRNKEGQETGSSSAYCFVDKTNGDVLKAASYKAPAKGARGNIFAADNGLGGVSQYGGRYLR